MTNKICKISLFSFILACVSAMPGDAAVKTKNSNRSYANAYQQVNALSYQQQYMDATNTYATTASATDNLPVMVDDERLANSILNAEASAPSVSDLDACAMIYPNGKFKWAVPESGIRQNQANQCVAIVELRDANSNTVLATTTLAAGDSMKCNIDYFPEASYNMAALSKIELPADEAPTIEDVEAVMNAEQKQNAGLKIAAGAIIAGVAGNLLAPKEAGSKTGKIPLGTGKQQLIDTAVGAAAGAGVMAASTYSGKVAGDTIKSTAVNAASGMLIGNMMAGASASDGVLATTKCSVGTGNAKQEHDCIIGTVQTFNAEGNISSTSGKVYLISKSGSMVKECTGSVNDSELTNCKTPDNYKGYVNIKVKLVNGKTDTEDFTKVQKEPTTAKRYVPKQTDSEKYEIVSDGTTSGDDDFFVIASANAVSNTELAYAVFPSGSLKKAFGYKDEDWKSLEPQAQYFKRYADGSAGDKITKDTNTQFKPSIRDGEDGGLIDMSNQARAKGTIVGTAAGGALGGFAGYQGAKTEVSERWTAAVTEYKGSLSNFICATGNRFLSQYNDYAQIPELNSGN